MSLFVFNNSQKLIEVIPGNKLIYMEQEEELNKLDALFAEIPLNVWDKLKEKAFYLAFQDAYDRFSYHMYRISKEDTEGNRVQLTGIQIGHDELKAKGYIKDRRFIDSTVTEAMNAIVLDTDWVLGYIDPELSKVNTNFYYISRLEALGKLLENVNAEVRFRVSVSGNKVNAKRIDIYKRLSSFKGKRFAYGSNLLEIVKEEDSSEVYTALVGRGKGEEKTDDTGDATGGYGRKINFADVVWTKPSKPVNKPKGQEFVELPEMTALYGYSDGKPRIGFIEFPGEEEPASVLELTYQALLESSRPKVQFNAVVETAGDMELGETVAIVRPDMDFRYKTRVFKIKRNLLDNRKTRVEFGDRLTQTLGDRIGNIDTTIKNEIDSVTDFVQTAANGKNKIFRGPTMPTSGMMKGDLWYKPVGNGETEMYQYDGENWVLIISSGVNEQVKGEIDAAKDTVADAVIKTEELETEANSILAGLGVGTIGSTHLATVNAIKANVGLRMDGLFTTIGNKPDYSDISTSVTQSEGRITTTINNIVGVNGTLTARVNTIQSTADGTSQRVENAIGTSGTFTNKVNDIKTTADGNTQTISNVKRFPGTEITGYQSIKETNELYERIIGSTETGIKNQVARIVMSDSIYRTEVTNKITGLSTSVTQLQDSWALRLNSGTDLVTAINATLEGVYVKGKYITLDGNTIVDGTFTVTNSMIANGISANKITTGTLNAANVNIINLNASKITSGTITGARSNWNLNTGKFVTSGAGGESIELENGKISSFSPDKLQSAVLDSASLRFHHNKGTGSQWVQISPYGTSYSNAEFQDVTLFRTNIGLGLKPGENNSYSQNVVFSMYGVAPQIAFAVRTPAGALITQSNIQARDDTLVLTSSNRVRIDSNAEGAGKGVFEARILLSNSNQNSSQLRIEGDTIALERSSELFIMTGGRVVLGNKGRSARYDIELNNVYSHGGGIASRLAGNEWIVHNGSGSLFLKPSGEGQAVYASNKERTVYYPMGASAFTQLSQRKFKTDIEPYENALSLLSTLKVRHYTKLGVEEIGLIVDEAPEQLISADKLGISLYDLINLNVGATQQISEMFYQLMLKVEKQEEEIKLLKGEI